MSQPDSNGMVTISLRIDEEAYAVLVEETRLAGFKYISNYIISAINVKIKADWALRKKAASEEGEGQSIPHSE